MVAAVAVAGTVGSLAGGAWAAGTFGTDQVGSDNGQGILLPSQQRITPAGTRHLVDNARLVSSTLSPDGSKVAALSWESWQGFLTITDARTGKVVQQVGTGTSTDPSLGDGSVASDGPLYSRDGRTLWFPQSSDLLRFSVLADGTVDPHPTVIPLADAKTGNAYLPSGMALSADGSRLYVALNGVNTLGVIDTATNQLIQQIPVGNAPRQVVLKDGKAYVSNEGGRPARAGEFTNQSNNTAIVSDPSTGAATTGTVSVVDLARGSESSTIPVGLEPSAEYLGADGTLFVANSNDDSVSLIDTATDKVAQTVNVNPLPGAKVGSYPNAITMPDAHTVLVSIGRDNAVAQYRYDGATTPLHYQGLIPTDWYPVNVQYDRPLGQLVVTNDKGIGARGAPSTITEGPGSQPATGHNSHDMTGSITEFPPQSQAQLEADTHQVFADNTWDQLLAREHQQAGLAPTPVPTRPGETSPIKHVFLIVKENRTYDQVFGDLGKGNGDPSLTQFGQRVTPNEHALTNTFGLLDNSYDMGTLSADGHNWLMQADANDYIEKEFGNWYRSYPASGGDPLAYQRDGFIWNAAARAGRSARSFGEYNNFFDLPNNPPTWSQWYHDSQVLEGKASGPLNTPVGAYPSHADIPSLNAITDHAYPIFDLDIPDQYRFDIWHQAFQSESANGTVPSFNMIWLPDDHTSGSTGQDPAPIAEVADNDLALGRIVDAISHSKDWASSAIFVAEDDPQDGVDHVDGHRAPFLVISPYAKRGIVDSAYYTQVNVVRTIEAILGMSPMNQVDRAAVPMSDVFTNTPDLTPYTARPNQIPLNMGIDATQAGYDPNAGAPAAGGTAATPATSPAPASQAAVVKAWQAWGASQHFGGRHPIADYANPRQLNRYDFYTSTGWTKPYPGDSKILTPDQVPGAKLPSDYLGG